MIGCFNCPITATCPITLSDYSQLSDYNYTGWLVKHKAADAPTAFEEIVMVMIRLIRDQVFTKKDVLAWELCDSTGEYFQVGE